MQHSKRDDQTSDIIELLYDRYPIRLPLILIALGLLVIYLTSRFGNSPIVMMAGCAGGLVFVAFAMLGYGILISIERRRRLLPLVCPNCGAGEAAGDVYIAVQIPEVDRQIVACSHCEITWKTDLRP